MWVWNILPVLSGVVPSCARLRLSSWNESSSHLRVGGLNWQHYSFFFTLKRSWSLCVPSCDCSTSAFFQSQCWTHLLKVLNTACRSSTSLPSPQFLHVCCSRLSTPLFLYFFTYVIYSCFVFLSFYDGRQETTDVVTSFLHKEHGSNMQIPRVLQMVGICWWTLKHMNLMIIYVK